MAGFIPYHGASSFCAITHLGGRTKERGDIDQITDQNPWNRLHALPKSKVTSGKNEPLHDAITKKEKINANHRP